MKILVVTNMYPGRDPDYGYKGVFVEEQVEALRKAGVEVDLYIIDGHKGYFHYMFGAFVLLYKYFFGRYDVVHCHYGLTALFTLMLPFYSWKKLVLTLHGGDILIEQGKAVQVRLTKFILPRISRVIILNKEMEGVVKEYSSNVVELACGADSGLFSGVYDSDRKKTIIFPGKKDRLVKNYNYFSEVLREYRSLGGEFEEIILDGYSRGEVSEIFNKASLLLMTSISEGSPQVVKEALLADLAVVSSDVGDVGNVLSGVAGTLLYDLSMPPSFVASKLDGVIGDALLTSGERRDRVFELELDQGSVIDKLIGIYRAIL